MDHSPEAQRRRQRLQVRKRRARTTDRDREIVADRVVSGLSERAIAAKHGMSRGGVRNVLNRDAPLFAQSGELLATIRAPRP